MSADTSNSMTGREIGRDRLERSVFALETPYVAPSGDTELKLTEIWEEVLGIEGLGAEDDYFLIGGDSLLGVTLFGEIQRVFGQAPPLSILLECPTVRRLATRLGAPGGAKAASPLVPIRSAGSKPPLFLAHAIDGDVVFAHKLLPYLPEDQPLYALRARGLEGEEAPHRRFEQMAADFVALIREVQPKGPYVLVGYCAGSLTALEMARQLRAAGEEIGFVGLIDPNTHPNAAPWLYWRHPDSAPVMLLRRAIALRDLVRGKLDRRPAARAAAAPQREPGESEDRFIRRSAIWAGITEALAVYRPNPYRGPVAIFGSKSRIAHLARRRPGWSALASEREIFSFPGGHLDLFDRSLPQLASSLRQALNRGREQPVRPAGQRGGSAEAA